MYLYDTSKCPQHQQNVTVKLPTSAGCFRRTLHGSDKLTTPASTHEVLISTPSRSKNVAGERVEPDPSPTGNYEGRPCTPSGLKRSEV